MSARAQISFKSRNERACAVTDPLFIPAQMHSGPPASRVVRLFPHLDPARVVPHDPLAICGIVPVRLLRQRFSGLRLKPACAVRAVADALATQPGPAVVGEAIGMSALDDLAQDVWQIFVVICAVDAGDVLVRGAIRTSLEISREPVRMRREAVLGGAIRIHPRHHEDAVVVRGLRQFAEEVAVAQEFRAMVQRELAWVVRHDSAGIDDDRLHLRPFPIPAPPLNVVANRILFGDVRLTPQVGASIPWRLPGTARLRRRTDERAGNCRHSHAAGDPVLEKPAPGDVSTLTFEVCLLHACLEP